jgi:hypothetical protein
MPAIVEERKNEPRKTKRENSNDPLCKMLKCGHETRREAHQKTKLSKKTLYIRRLLHQKEDLSFRGFNSEVHNVLGR